MAKTKKALPKAGKAKRNKRRKDGMLELKKGTKPFKIVTVEKGEITLDVLRVCAFYFKNFGTARKPLTKLKLRATDGSEEVLHILEGPRKFSRRYDALWVAAKPPKQKVLKRTFTAENLQRKIKAAAKAFIKKYRFTPNIIRFNLRTWKKMTSRVNTLPGRMMQQNVQDVMPKLKGADLQDSSIFSLANSDAGAMLITINPSLKSNEFELQFSPMGGLMQLNRN